ncbi:hypothetical protein OUZ56_032896 [Daphnia magna]|uniref:Uncharacterized protein n=1 Tax=Daphnia magna TaxID=35525 RepID=A0ABR0BA82_9CRUS|nr:hypothetical protein OUZ56_032896 [Daphnia magna]
MQEPGTSLENSKEIKFYDGAHDAGCVINQFFPFLLLPTIKAPSNRPLDCHQLNLAFGLQIAIMHTIPALYYTTTYADPRYQNELFKYCYMTKVPE